MVERSRRPGPATGHLAGSRPGATSGEVSRGQRHGPRKLSAGGHVEVVCDGGSRDNGLSLFLRGYGKGRDSLRISIRYGICRAERYRVALRRWRRNTEIARGIVERVAVDRRTGLLENRSAVVGIPMHVIAGLR